MLITFRDTLRRTLPRWLTLGRIGTLIYALGIHIDALMDQLLEGIRRRFPGLDSNDSLSLIGNERRIPRGPAEDPAAYTQRLRQWLDTHRTRGNPFTMLRQLWLFFSGTVAADLQFWTGTVYHLALDGSITRQELNVNFDSDSSKPYRWRLLIHWPFPVPQKAWGDGHRYGSTVWGSGLDPDTVANVRTIPAWGNSAHARGTIVLQNGGRTWGIPPHNWGSGNWGSGTTATFDVDYQTTGP